jgi:hypothetical protein
MASLRVGKKKRRNGKANRYARIGIARGVRASTLTDQQSARRREFHLGSAIRWKRETFAVKLGSIERDLDIGHRDGLPHR